ncbi:MAG TPA: lipopolysaccharide assembly protein LapA domain-containing protein, partial [Wenzhouxiangella sp.]|nr:lipopolysaccharide assembly protein LapA domain-containing protein [Wenzhouxiangella sp.]
YRWLLILLVLLAAIAGLVIGVLNGNPATLDLLVVEVTLPLGGLVLLALAGGVLGGLILAWLLFILPGRLKRRIRSSKNGKGAELADRQHG